MKLPIEIAKILNNSRMKSAALIDPSEFVLHDTGVFTTVLELAEILDSIAELQEPVFYNIYREDSGEVIEGIISILKLPAKKADAMRAVKRWVIDLLIPVFELSEDEAGESISDENNSPVFKASNIFRNYQRREDNPIFSEPAESFYEDNPFYSHPQDLYHPEVYQNPEGFKQSFCDNIPF